MKVKQSHYKIGGELWFYHSLVKSFSTYSYVKWSCRQQPPSSSNPSKARQSSLPSSTPLPSSTLASSLIFHTFIPWRASVTCSSMSPLHATPPPIQTKVQHNRWPSSTKSVDARTLSRRSQTLSHTIIQRSHSHERSKVTKSVETDAHKQHIIIL